MRGFTYGSNHFRVQVKLVLQEPENRGIDRVRWGGFGKGNNRDQMRRQRRMERLFIADKKEFAESKKWVDHVFNTEQELPEKVFQESFHGFKFEEFD